MGIPVGWNVVRDEARLKDVLHADLTGRSPIRRRLGRARTLGAFDTGGLDTGGLDDGHRSRLSHAPAPPVPGLREAGDERESTGDDRPLPPLTRGFAPAHPPLRRVGHRRIPDGPLPASSLRESWSPASTLDGLDALGGLGDRERSNSVSSTSSHLPWQTFLSTVVPDPVAPTAESSFASAAASASFTASSSRATSSNSNSAASSTNSNSAASSINSNSAASERTHLTVPSRRASPAPRTHAHMPSHMSDHMPESFARACESSDDGDSTASDTDDDAAAHPLSRRRMRPSYFADAPPSPRRHGRSVMDTGNEARRYVRSFYSHDYHFQAPPEHEADSFTTVDDDAPSTSPASPLDQELRDARTLLERLTRRGDIGDDFWASVGLTRSFSDGIERVQERGRY